MQMCASERTFLSLLEVVKRQGGLCLRKEKVGIGNEVITLPKR